MDFGDALRALKDGKRVSRAGWNGKGMWLRYRSGLTVGVHGEDLDRGVSPVVQSFIEMFTADQTLVPWLCSQTDMLAVDWGIV